MASLSPDCSDDLLGAWGCCSSVLAASRAALLVSASISAESSGSGSSVDVGVGIKTGDDELVEESLFLTEAFVSELGDMSELFIWRRDTLCAGDLILGCCLGMKRWLRSDPKAI